jgi:hypothetical protein
VVRPESFDSLAEQLTGVDFDSMMHYYLQMREDVARA